VGRGFGKLLLSRSEEKLAKFIIELELAADGTLHDCVLPLVPVESRSRSIFVGKSFGDHRLLGLGDLLLQLGIGEFLRQIVMLDRRPALAVEIDGEGREVGELAMSL
jgi:hypothetical protein